MSLFLQEVLYNNYMAPILVAPQDPLTGIISIKHMQRIQTMLHSQTTKQK